MFLAVSSTKPDGKLNKINSLLSHLNRDALGSGVGKAGSALSHPNPEDRQNANQINRYLYMATKHWVTAALRNLDETLTPLAHEMNELD